MISISCVYATDVNNNTAYEDSFGVDTPSQDSLDDLDDKIKNSSSGEVITLQKDYYCGESNRSDEIDIINQNITIDGQGHFFDGNGSNLSKLFVVHSENVTFKSIRFINWDLVSNSLIEWKSTNGAMINCTFENNIAEISEIIDWSGMNGTMRSCNFTNNSNLEEGIIRWDGDFGTVEFSYFENNMAYLGGIIYWNGKDGKIYNSTFADNLAYEGGAVYWNINNGTVMASKFRNNYAFNGGAIYCSGSSFNVVNTSFEDNRADEKGGALYCENNADIISCEFIHNNASLGGGVYCFDNSEVLINDTLFQNNSANSGGAALIEYDAVILYSKFINNEVNETGGALFIKNLGLISDSMFVNNTAISTESVGGAIYCGDFLELCNCNFTANSAYMGGAVFTEDWVFVSNSTFYKNSANSAGALYLCNGEISDSIFSENTARTGGAIYVVESLNVYNSSFVKNTAVDGSNNIVSLSQNVTVNNTVSDSTIFVKLAILFAESSNVSYGDSVKIILTLSASNNTQLNDGVVYTTINNKKYSANVLNNSAIIVIPNLDAGNYSVSVIYASDEYCGIDDCNFTVFKVTPDITAKTASYIINYGGKYSITLKNSNGSVISNQKVTFVVKGKNIGSATTNSKGIATIKLTAKILKNLKAGKKNLVIKVEGNNCNSVSKTVKIKINKEKTKINAKKKTFKKSKKVKKYVMKLKNSKGKAVKKVKIVLKVNGKTYKAKTNSKGKATFKISKLNKKGNFKATVKFKANKYYKTSFKKVKIRVK